MASDKVDNDGNVGERNVDTLPSRIRVIPVIVLAVALFVAAGTYDRLSVQQYQENSHYLNNFGIRVAVSLEEVMTSAENTLKAVNALFASTGDVSRQTFSKYGALAIEELEGLQAIEWIPRVPTADRESFEAAARRDGFKDFVFRERSDSGLVPAPERAEYFPVYFVEPVAGNEAAVGYDLASNSVRRAALEQARDTAAVVSSARVTLVQRDEKLDGVIVFSPLFENGTAPQTVEGRRNELTGFGLGVFRLNDLVGTAISPVEGFDEFAVYLYDISGTDERETLYRNVKLEDSEYAKTMGDAAKLVFVHDLVFGSRNWQLVVAPLAGGGAIVSSELPTFVAVVVFFIVVTLGYFFYSLIKRRVKAEQLVGERNQELEQSNLNLSASESRVSAIVDTIIDGVLTIDEKGSIQSVNPACEKIFGYASADLVGNNIKMLMPDPYHREHDGYLHSYVTTGEAKIIGTGREVEGRRSDGQTFPMELGVAKPGWVPNEHLWELSAILRNVARLTG